MPWLGSFCKVHLFCLLLGILDPSLCPVSWKLLDFCPFFCFRQESKSHLCYTICWKWKHFYFKLTFNYGNLKYKSTKGPRIMSFSSMLFCSNVGEKNNHFIWVEFAPFPHVFSKYSGFLQPPRDVPVRLSGVSELSQSEWVWVCVSAPCDQRASCLGWVDSLRPELLG